MRGFVNMAIRGQRAADCPRRRLDRTFTCASNLHFRLHRRCIVAKSLLIKGKLRRRPNLGRQNVLGNAEAEEQPFGEPILRDISDAVSHCRLNAAKCDWLAIDEDVAGIAGTHSKERQRQFCAA